SERSADGKHRGQSRLRRAISGCHRLRRILHVPACWCRAPRGLQLGGFEHVCHTRRSSEEERMPRGAVQCGAIVLLIVIAATGCSTIEENPKTAIGGLGGAAFGGLIAAAAGGGGAAIAGAVIGGALLGGLVGNMLDQRDKRLQAEAAQKAFENSPAG